MQRQLGSLVNCLQTFWKQTYNFSAGIFQHIKGAFDADDVCICKGRRIYQRTGIVQEVVSNEFGS